MSNVPYVDIEGNESVTARVELAHAADVMLLDQNNFNNYKSGRKFKYAGGHYTKTPVNLTVSGRGRWYLVVIGGGQYKYGFN